MNDPTLEPVVADFIEEHRLDTVAGAFAFENGEDLHKPGLGNRRRTRIKVCDEENRCWELYLKRYWPLPALRRLGRRLVGHGSETPARREFLAARDLRRCGVPTMRPVTWGAESDLLGVRRSFVIVTAVPGDAIERAGYEFFSRYAERPEMIDKFTQELIFLVRGLHESGYVHRDLYASHVFLFEHDGRVVLSLIDLARAFRPRWRKFRWRVKDLAQLKYSMPWIWVEQHWSAFLRGYLGEVNEKHFARWSRAIDRKVKRMQRRRARKVAAGEGN